MNGVDSAVTRWFPAVLDVPLVRFLGARAVDPNDPSAGLVLQVGQSAVNAAGALHGGAFAALLDLAAYLAVLPLLGPDEQAVTHAIAASYIGPLRVGDTAYVRGEVLRRSSRLAFTTATMSDDKQRLVATASVTKSIIVTATPNPKQ